MKKNLLAFVIVVLCFFTLAACKEKSVNNRSLSSATWSGYTDLSFTEFIEAGINKIPDEIADIKSYKVTVSEGWEQSELLKEYQIAEGKTKVTYSLAVTFAEEEPESVEILIFGEVDNKTNILEVLGCSADGEELGQEETTNGIEMIRIVVEEGLEVYYESAIETRMPAITE